jgi:transcriptional regulator with XRE-family HTH domain
MDVRVRVGLNLQELRRSRGFSQDELAYRAKVSQTYLSGIERGARNASLDLLARLSAALEVDVEELMRRRRR